MGDLCHGLLLQIIQMADINIRCFGSTEECLTQAGRMWRRGQGRLPGGSNTWSWAWNVNRSCYCSVTQSCSTLQSHGLQHNRLLCPSPSPGTCSNSYPLSQWCHLTTLSSVIPFSSYLQSFPASGSFPMSQFFASGCQSIGASASASILPMNIQGWFPLGLTVLISLRSKGLSRIFPTTTAQKPQFFSVQPSLWSNTHIHTWLLEKP